MDRTPREEPMLDPMLRDAHSTLEDALDEACASKPAEQETTGEMIRLEENLSVAAEAAKRAVSIRRRMREQGDLASEPPPEEPTDQRTDAV